MKRVVVIVSLFVAAHFAGCAKTQAHPAATNANQHAKEKLDLTTVDMSKSANQPTYHRYRSDSARLPRSASQ